MSVGTVDPDTAPTAAVDAVLSRYFNLEVALVGGWGPELTVTRARLVTELTDIVAKAREAERQRIRNGMSGASTYHGGVKCYLVPADLLDGTS